VRLQKTILGSQYQAIKKSRCYNIFEKRRNHGLERDFLSVETARAENQLRIFLLVESQPILLRVL
jgi:hypothetical protein